MTDEWAQVLLAFIAGAAALSGPFLLYRSNRGRMRKDDQEFYRVKISDLEKEVERMGVEIRTLREANVENKKEKLLWVSELDRVRDEYTVTIARLVERTEHCEQRNRLLEAQNAKLSLQLSSLMEGSDRIVALESRIEQLHREALEKADKADPTNVEVEPGQAIIPRQVIDIEAPTNGETK